MNPTTPLHSTLSRVADVVATNLENRLLEGSLKPGDRLPSERSLALELGMSRPSLREAIQKLVSKGLLSTRHGGGTVVTDRLDAPFVDPWKDMLTGHPLLQSDMLEFRHMLEGEATRLAAERATDADLVRIETAFTALEKAYASDNIQACVDTDVAFHQALAEAAHNALIGHTTASLMRVMHGHVASNLAHLRTQPTQWERLREQHRAIWEAVRNRDTAMAMQTAHAHIHFVQQSMDETARQAERRDRALRRLN